MHVSMPVVDGFEACRRMRSQPDRRLTPVLMITRADDTSAIARAYDAGATDFQTTPLNWTVVRQRVKYMLRTKRALDASQHSQAENHALLRAIPDLMFQITKDGTFVDFKPARGLEPVTPPDDFLGKRVFDVLPTDVAHLCLHFIQRALSTNEPQVFEYRLTPNGGTQEFEARIVASGTDQALAIVRDVTEQKQMLKQMRFLAHYDGLTQLPNRKLFRDQLTQALSEAQQRRELLSVVFIDVDNFKQVNDSFGHGMGDLVLKQAAERLASCRHVGRTREYSGEPDPSPVIGRFGGDEFTILIRDMSDLPSSRGMIGRVIDAFADPFQLGAEALYLTVSSGSAVYPFDGNDADTLLTHADAAMHTAKGIGRNSHCSYRPAIGANASAKLSLEGELRRAIEQDEFRLFFQPKVDVTRGRISSAEALIRWQHPTRGLVWPFEFIQLAEEIGLNVSIGDWVIRSALAHCVSWRDRTGQPLPVAVNLSNSQFRDRGLPDRVQENLAQHELSPSCLEVEITESVIMQDQAAIKQLLQRFRDVGVRVAIDDFGTGYSALSALKGLPINTLKIDRCFIRDLVDSRNDRAITAALIEMGHSLRMTVVAEGVETEAQLDAIRAQRCDLAQGYLFSRPVPPDEFMRLLVNADSLARPANEAPEHEQVRIVSVVDGAGPATSS